MKTLNTFIIVLFSILNTTAQVPQLFGTATEGGNYQGGTIFSLNGDGNNFQKKFEFKQDAGFNPMYCQLLDGGDGYLYGIAARGGKYSDGTIFKIRLSDYRVELVHEIQNFTDGFALDNHQEGNDPSGSLMKALDGNFYGMCSTGGAFWAGTIFKVNPLSGKYEVVFDFHDDNSTGSSPRGSLIQLPDGMMYGITGIQDEGSYHKLFSFDPSTLEYEVLADLAGSKYFPSGTLLYGQDGKLYGTTKQGGTGNHGSLFRFDLSTKILETLVSFGDSGLIGKGPSGMLLQATDGKIYGTVGHGSNGNIFSFDPSIDSLFMEHNFNDSIGGAYSTSEGGVYQADDGWLYGTTNSYGTIFRFNPLTKIFQKLHDFTEDEGRNFLGTLMKATDGLLYGVSEWGGGDDKGTVFSFNPGTNEVKQVYQFLISDHGSNPSDGLVQNVNGNIYGFTHEGGDFHAGVMFNFKPSDTALHEYFEYREDLDAAYLPRGTLSPGPNGKYYGAALYHFDGGATIYSFDPATQQYQIEKEVNNTLLGEKPEGKMIMLSDGNFYGTMSRGGTKDYGTIYRFNPGNATYEEVYDIQDTTLGIHPAGSFAEWNGYLFGMMDQGGNAGQGTLFRFDPVQQHYDKLIDFVDSMNGKNPAGRLITSTNGLLYGNTSSGGAKKGGTLFSFNPQTNQLVTLVNFNAATTGSKPKGTLLQASDGAVYGTTSLGGNFNYGTVFRYDPSTASYQVLHHFNNLDGRYPEGELMEYDPSLTSVGEIVPSNSINAYPNPFTDYTTISIETPWQENLVAVITNVEGKIFLQQRVMNTSFTISRNSLPAGIFFLQVMNDNEESLARMKIVIQ